MGQGAAAEGTESLNEGRVQEEAKAASETGTRMHAREEKRSRRLSFADDALFQTADHRLLRHPELHASLRSGEFLKFFHAVLMSIAHHLLRKGS